MRTETINIYKFEELTEDAKQAAINNLSDINVDFSWWDSVYEDAANIGLKITGFDIDRGSYCAGDFTLSAAEVAQNISINHGETCSTYKTAENFIDEWQPLFASYMDETSPDYESIKIADRMMECENRFLSSLLNDYLKLLSQEYEYQTSKDAIIETIKANDYEFTEDGKIH